MHALIAYCRHYIPSHLQHTAGVHAPREGANADCQPEGFSSVAVLHAQGLGSGGSSLLNVLVQPCVATTIARSTKACMQWHGQVQQRAVLSCSVVPDFLQHTSHSLEPKPYQYSQRSGNGLSACDNDACLLAGREFPCLPGQRSLCCSTALQDAADGPAARCAQVPGGAQVSSWHAEQQCSAAHHVVSSMHLCMLCRACGSGTCRCLLAGHGALLACGSSRSS
jgi:hypothetical protein